VYEVGSPAFSAMTVYCAVSVSGTPSLVLSDFARTPNGWWRADDMPPVGAALAPPMPRSRL
jgi:hypothetical protein